MAFTPTRVMTTFVMTMLFIFTVCVFTTNAQSSPTLITSISTSSISALASKLLPVVFEQLVNTQIPEVQQGGVTISDIRLTATQLVDFHLDAISPDNYIAVQLTSFALSAGCRVGYKKGPIKIGANGSADVRGTASIHVVFVNVDNDHFDISVPTVDFALSKFEIHTSGGKISRIIGAIIMSLFRKEIKNSIQQQIRGTIGTLLESTSKNIVSQIPTSTTIDDFATLSFQPLGPVRYDNNAISVSFNALARPINTSLPIPQVELHHIDQILVPSRRLFSVLIDTASFNSILQSQTFPTFTFDQDHHSMNPPVPGWIWANWRDAFPEYVSHVVNPFTAAIQIQASFATVPQIVIRDNHLGCVASLVLNFYVPGDETIYASIALHFMGDASLTVSSSNVVTIQLGTLSATLEIVSSDVGKIDVNGFNTLVPWIANNVVVSFVNTKPPSFAIPSAGPMALVNPDVSFPSGAIFIEADVDIAS